jgi:uncharacterized protein (DUF1800 family)
MGTNAKSYDILAITDNLDYSRASHLLNRCMFGAKKGEVDAMVGKSISSALATLTQVLPAPAPPVSYDAKDLDVLLGQTWINAAYNSTYNSYRLQSLRSSWIGQMMQQGTSLTEKMTLFWHNHFVTETAAITYASIYYQYNALLRKYALGNIKQLVSEITVNPAMLIYLNGESNKASAPNENFGRELFELFTIGKGPLIGDGNYTNYTEADIKAAAKVLTGWLVNRTTYTSYYDTARHDKTTKVFSDAFNKTSLSNKEAEEYKLLVEMIFSKKETARYLARKIYRWFMYYQIDQVVENQIIEPLATTLFNNNYEIKPMLEQLLSSEHFFSTDFFGSQIKNPLEFTIGVYRKCEIALSPNPLTNYEACSDLYYSCNNMEMTLGDPPDVAGWPEYYKDPAYYELWINSSTVPMRTSFTDTFCNSGITKSGFKFVVDPFLITGKVKDPSDVNVLINGLAQILLPVTLSSSQVLQLKEVLIPGLPVTTWTFEWNKYTTNPNDATQKSLISKKLLALLIAIFRLPEFYLT